MIKTKNVKPRTEIALDVFEVNACKDKKLQPYFNLFHSKGGNYAEQKLGELFGAIQIFDDSKNSAYLPNVIAQVIKKEFYSDPRKTTDKAFEAALHKANLALTDLAQHEIVEWMGKLHAVIGVIQKNNMHFTQAGGGRILLIRNKLISDVSRGLDDGEGIGHPIKTFSNISSGKLTFDDKVLFCTETVFDSLSWEELKRHCKTFNSAEFDNIFRATLMAEAEQAGALVANVQEKVVQYSAALSTPVDNTDDKNYFGKELPTTASVPPLSPSPQTDVPTPNPISAQPQEKNEVEEKVVDENLEKEQQLLAEEEELAPPTSLDAHQEIYIKEEDQDDMEVQPEKSALAEKWHELWFSVRVYVKTNWPRAKRKIGIKLHQLGTQLKVLGQKLVQLLKTALQTLHVKSKQLFTKKKISSDPRPTVTLPEVASPVQANFHPAKNARAIQLNALILKLQKTITRIIRRTIRLLSRTSKRTALIALGAIVIVLAIFWFTRSEETPANSPSVSSPTPETPQPETTPTPAPSDTQPSSSLSIETLAPLGDNVSQMVGLRDELFFLGANDAFYRYNTKNNLLSKVETPAELRNIKAIARMTDLNLIFLITPTSVYSFSPVVNKFETNNISLPGNISIGGADTYMTYLYLIDKQANQIYRYNRATGGFGQREDWYDDSFSLSQANDMTIDGSVFLSFADGAPKKLFKGKAESTFQPQGSLSNSHALFTQNENRPLYVLDENNGKILELSKDGAVKKEYVDPIIKDTKDFWIDGGKIYLVSKDNQLLSIGL